MLEHLPDVLELLQDILQACNFIFYCFKNALGFTENVLERYNNVLEALQNALERFKTLAEALKNAVECFGQTLGCLHKTRRK